MSTDFQMNYHHNKDNLHVKMQGIFDGKFNICFAQRGLPLRCPAYCRVEGVGRGQRPLPCI